MTLRINITDGAQFVSTADRDRAYAAAVDAMGDADPIAAAEEFDRQINAAMGDTSKLSGLAEVWDRVQSAANRALTHDWHDTAGAFCEVIAE